MIIVGNSVFNELIINLLRFLGVLLAPILPAFMGYGRVVSTKGWSGSFKQANNVPYYPYKIYKPATATINAIF